jgi:hypothetical protein
MELYKSERITKFYFISRWWVGDIGIPITQENGIIEHDAYKWASIDDLKNQEDLIIPVEVFERALTK